MDNALNIGAKEKSNQAPRTKIWRERALAEDELFEGINEVGESGWFLRLNISGLYARRIGPFSTREEALVFAENFLYEVVLGPMIDEIDNNMQDNQVCVVEGVPRLAASVIGQ